MPAPGRNALRLLLSLGQAYLCRRCLAWVVRPVHLRDGGERLYGSVDAHECAE